MKIVGLTGGIGSGKSTVARFFTDLGIPVYIADQAAKKLMHHSPVKDEILELFGAKSYDTSGQLNRKFIAEQVFSAKEKLEQLNAIVHPRVEEDFQKWVASQETSYILYEAAILFETGKYKNFDYCILVVASENERIKRLQKRDSASEREIRQRMQHQWSDARKKKLADTVIDNHNLSKTKSEVLKLHLFLSKI